MKRLFQLISILSIISLSSLALGDRLFYQEGFVGKSFKTTPSGSTITEFSDNSDFSSNSSSKLKTEKAIKSFVESKIAEAISSSISTLGTGAAGEDVELRFDGESSDGYITWMEDEALFTFSSSILPSFSAQHSLGSATNLWERLYLSDSIIFQGDGFSTTLTYDEPTSSNKTIRLPNASGTILTTGNLSDISALYFEGEKKAEAFSNQVRIYPSLQIGEGALGVDYTLTFNGESSTGVLTYLEDESLFGFNRALVPTASLASSDSDLGHENFPWRNFYIANNIYYINPSTSYTTTLRFDTPTLDRILVLPDTSGTLMINPMNTKGQLIYRGETSYPQVLDPPASGTKVLTITGGTDVPYWGDSAAVSAGNDIDIVDSVISIESTLNFVTAIDISDINEHFSITTKGGTVGTKILGGPLYVGSGAPTPVLGAGDLYVTSDLVVDGFVKSSLAPGSSTYSLGSTLISWNKAYIDEVLFKGTTYTNSLKANEPSSADVTTYLPASGGTLVANPMTGGNDLIIGGTNGSPTRLAGPSTDGYVLKYDAGSGTLTWAEDSGGISYTAGNDINIALGEISLESELNYVQTITRDSGDLTISTTTSGNIELSTALTSGLVKVTGGNLKVGTGTPYNTLDGGDAMVAGTLDVLGGVYTSKLRAISSTSAYDVMEIAPGGVGSSSWIGTLRPADLSSDRTWTLPDVSGSVVVGAGSDNYAAYWAYDGTLTYEAQLSRARGGTGVDASTLSNGQLLIGSASGFSLATLTAGSGVSITNGAGSITIASTGLSNPMTTAGDIIYGGPSGTPTRLAGASVDNYVLKYDLDTNTPYWGIDEAGEGVSYTEGNDIDFIGNTINIEPELNYVTSITRDSSNLALSTTTSGNITLTTATSSGLVNVLTGNLKVGDAAPGVTLGGEDLYVEGSIETADKLYVISSTPYEALRSTVSGDTAWWLGNMANLDGVSNDSFSIGTGTTFGSNSRLTISPVGDLATTGDVSIASTKSIKAASNLTLQMDYDNNENAYFYIKNGVGDNKFVMDETGATTFSGSVTGIVNLTASGNLSVGGVSSSLVPTTHVAYDLGSSAKYWDELFTDVAYIGNPTLKDSIRINPVSKGTASKIGTITSSDLTDARTWTFPDESGTVALTSDIGAQLVFNVKDYGAVGNGSTDDTTAIQNAINAAKAAGGGIVFLPAGTYLISSTLTIDDSYIGIRGAGKDITTIQRSFATGHTIKIYKGSGRINYNDVRDLTLKQVTNRMGVGSSGPEAHGYAHLYIEYAYHTIVENLMLYDGRIGAFFVNVAGPFRLEHCDVWVTSLYSNSVDADRASAGFFFHGTNVDKDGVTRSHVCDGYTRGLNVNVVGGTSRIKVGYYITGADSIWLSDSHAHHYSEAGVKIAATEAGTSTYARWLNGIRITECWFDPSDVAGGKGIWVTGNANYTAIYDLLISNNHITQSAVPSAPTYSIYLDSPKLYNVTIANNTITHRQGAGIYLGDSYTTYYPKVISNNIFRSQNSVSGSTSYAIYVAPSVRYVNITGNGYRGDHTAGTNYGIYLAGSNTGTKLANNTFAGTWTAKTSGVDASHVVVGTDDTRNYLTGALSIKGSSISGNHVIIDNPDGGGAGYYVSSGGATVAELYGSTSETILDVTGTFKLRTDAGAVERMTVDSSGVVDAKGGLKINGTTVLSSARQLQSIASLDSTTISTIKSAMEANIDTFTGDITVTKATPQVMSKSNDSSNAITASAIFSANAKTGGTGYYRFQVNDSTIAQMAANTGGTYIDSAGTLTLRTYTDSATRATLSSTGNLFLKGDLEVTESGKGIKASSNTAGKILVADGTRFVPVAMSGDATLSSTGAISVNATSGVKTFMATPSSANLSAAVTDETGSGALVFGTAPSISLPVTAKTSSYTINTSTDKSGTVFFMQNSSADVIFTLPSGVAGYTYTFIKNTNQYNMKIQKGSGVYMYWSDGTITSGITASAAYTVVTVVCNSPNYWYVTSTRGTWSSY